MKILSDDDIPVILSKEFDLTPLAYAVGIVVPMNAKLNDFSRDNFGAFSFERPERSIDCIVCHLS